MEDEIDLRSYLNLFLRHWLWIVGLALLAAVAAFVVSLQMPDRYTAASVLLVTEPRYQMEFDSRFSTEQATPAYKAFPTLATSDSILRAVVDAYQPSRGALGGREWNLETLRDMAEATSGGDPSLVVLTITSRSAGDAAALANAWADILAREGNEIYGGSEREVTFLETQLQQARASLEAADAAMIEFEARNETHVLETEQASLYQTQADYLADQRQIAYIVQDIQGLRQQLAERPAAETASLADSLTMLSLQMKAFNALSVQGLQLQVDSNAALSEKSLPEQIAFLDDLVATLEAKSSEIDTRLAELQPEILELQRELQVIRVESDQLVQARDLARETYLTLARKVDEIRIAAQETNGVLQVGSYAAVPQKPTGPRKLLVTAVAGMLGLVVGIFGVFFVDFWRQGSPSSG